jgi:ribonuclease HII
MSGIQGSVLTAGVDEAGRGPLAGPVIAAAVILHPDRPIPGVADSKKLTAAQRELLFPLIQEYAIAWAIGRADVEEIDEINILQATMKAMQRAIAALSVMPHLALIDGNRAPELPCRTRAIIGGDDLEPSISAASILAKVTRDREMILLHDTYPAYGFAQHKGYATAEHLKMLREHGACAIHRRSFEPVSTSLRNFDLLIEFSE